MSSQAEDEFLEEHKKLLFSAIKRLGRNPQDEDIQQVARLAMLSAYRNFDPNYGTQFSTYFYSHLKRALINYYYENKKYNNEISNYQTFKKDGESEYGDLDVFVNPDNAFTAIEDKIILTDLLSKLEEDERDILLDVIVEGNSLRSGIRDREGDRKTEYLYRRRNRKFKKALGKIRALANGLEEY